MSASFPLTEGECREALEENGFIIRERGGCGRKLRVVKNTPWGKEALTIHAASCVDVCRTFGFHERRPS